MDVSENVFFKIKKDSNIIGWGCTTPDSVTSETKDTIIDCFKKIIKDIFIWEDPIKINYINDIIDEKIKGNPSLRTGVNMALYNILGKQANMPLYKLL